MKTFVEIFGRTKSVIIGMIHLKALPGSPKCTNSIKDIVNLACSEAETYQRAGVDGIHVENMFDMPWLKAGEIGPETVASMSVICAAVKRSVNKLPVGVQVLAGANREALSIALAADLQYIRAEGYVFSHVGDEGLHDSCAAQLTRYRKHIGAEHIHIYTDIKKKHCSHAITSDVSVSETAQAAELFLSDGVIVTGTTTGSATNTDDLHDVQKAVTVPVLIGSGVTENNIQDYISANAIIVGTNFKVDGKIENNLDETYIKRFMRKVQQLRQEKA